MLCGDTTKPWNLETISMQFWNLNRAGTKHHRLSRVTSQHLGLVLQLVNQFLHALDLDSSCSFSRKSQVITAGIPSSIFSSPPSTSRSTASFSPSTLSCDANVPCGHCISPPSI